MSDAGISLQRPCRGSRVRLIWLPALLLWLAGCAREAVPLAPSPNAPAPWSGPEWRAPHLPARIAPPIAPYKWPEARQLWPRIRPPEWAGAAALPFIESVQRAATYYQLPPELLWAVIKVESNFRDQVVSRAGAIGLMQLMPSTARYIGVRNARDPHQNILGGAYYLRHLANRFEGDLYFTLAAYNAGPVAVQRYRGVPPFPETENYVRQVLSYYWNSLPPAPASSAGGVQLIPPG
jgi:soluble lytic murein transglycosylase-like protein